MAPYRHSLVRLFAFIGSSADRGVESSAEEDIQQAYKNYSDLMIGFVIESHSQTLERLGSMLD